MKMWPKILMSSIAALILAGILVPFLIPIPPLEGLVPPNELADPDSRFIDVNGLQVHYKEAGAGEPPLLLLHGFGASLYSWREVMGPLSEPGRRVVAFDRPAFGLTERPMEWTGVNPYTPESQADLTVGLMNVLGIEQAVLVGNSAGGAVAVLAALRHPERVRALVLVDPAVYQNSPGGWVALAARTPQLQRLGPLIARRIQVWGRQFAESAWHDPTGLTPEIWEGYTRPLRVENWDRALWHLTAAGSEVRLDQQLDRLLLPVLVITGDDDRIVPTELSIRLASELPQAELIVVPSCGHVPQEECPQAFLEAVESFINRLELE